MTRHGREPLENADYRDARLHCDVVLKGGITSGIVYPHAICELARTYRFRSVGGSSAGAIAAAATAAAELGRDSGGFNKLAALPEWLAAEGRILDQFRPSPPLERLFEVGIVVAGGGGRAAAAIQIGRQFRNELAVGALPGLVAAGAAVGLLVSLESNAATVFLASLAAALALLVACVGALANAGRAGFTDLERIPDEMFGISAGFSPKGTEDGPLTNWLAALLNDLAGRPGEPNPLTFGDLWGTRPPLEDETADHEIQLEVMVTNLTNGKGVRLPRLGRDWYFDPAEMRRLFPEDVVRWMEENPPQLSERGGTTQDSALRRELLRPLRPFPDAEKLPVIVATRMSLSFPILLAAVPIHRVDWSKPSNYRTASEWRTWLSRQADDWDPAESPIDEWPADRPTARFAADRCWISDGGIASNLPIHFFDRPLPRWPTFAIDLGSFPPGTRPSELETENSWMPERTGDGVTDAFRSIGGTGALSAASFLFSVVRTMQNRSDEALKRMPGYRDRIVEVRLAGNEGGMNLAMPPDRVKLLAERGRGAGEKLVDAFTRDSGTGEISWDAHRWTRLRISLLALEQLTATIRSGLESQVEPGGARDYWELLRRRRQDPPSNYRIDAERTDLAELQLRGALELARAMTNAHRSFAEGAPRPSGRVRVVPEES